MGMRGYRRTARALTLRGANSGPPGAKKVFREVASGAKTNRAQLRRLLDQLETDDLMVTRLDRLARSTRDLLNSIMTRNCTEAPARSDRPLRQACLADGKCDFNESGADNGHTMQLHTADRETRRWATSAAGLRASHGARGQ
jgi:hypothetical protein